MGISDEHYILFFFARSHCGAKTTCCYCDFQMKQYKDPLLQRSEVRTPWRQMQQMFCVMLNWFFVSVVLIINPSVQQRVLNPSPEHHFLCKRTHRMWNVMLDPCLWFCALWAFSLWGLVSINSFSRNSNLNLPWLQGAAQSFTLTTSFSSEEESAWFYICVLLSVCNPVIKYSIHRGCLYT